MERRVILLDTHVLIWLALQPEKLSKPASKAIAEAEQILLADISLWEIAMLISKGRLQVDAPINTFIQLALQSYNVQVRSITPAIADASVTLPKSINFDPADRLIAATALVADVGLITADKNLRKAQTIKTIW